MQTINVEYDCWAYFKEASILRGSEFKRLSRKELRYEMEDYINWLNSSSTPGGPWFLHPQAGSIDIYIDKEVKVIIMPTRSREVGTWNQSLVVLPVTIYYWAP